MRARSATRTTGCGKRSSASDTTAKANDAGKQSTERPRARCRKLRQLQNASSTGILTDVSKLTIAEFLKHWLEGPAKEYIGDTTWPRYEQLIRLRINLYVGGVRLTKLTPMHIEQMLADLRTAGVGARGRQMAVNVLSGT